MCHILIGCFLRAAVSCLPVIYMPLAIAQPAIGLDQSFSNSLTDMPSENLDVSGAFYLPVYSSVSMSQGKMRADFSVTLSIHNASEVRPLVLRRITYFDTGGKLEKAISRRQWRLSRSQQSKSSFRLRTFVVEQAPILWWTG